MGERGSRRRVLGRLGASESDVVGVRTPPPNVLQVCFRIGEIRMSLRLMSDVLTFDATLDGKKGLMRHLMAKKV